MTTPADELRQAAALLREAASHATKGPWRTHDTWIDRGGHTATVLTDRESINDTELVAWLPTMSNQPWDEARNAWRNAGWMALMHPGVGVALADWLDAAAEYYTPGPAHPTHVVHALVVARQVLGTTDQQPTTTPVPVDRAAEPSAAVVRKKLRRWAYAAGHIESELDGAADRMYELIARDVQRRMADEAQQPETKAATEEQIVREHVTTVHLIGEQLEAVESWLWERLAEVREAASAADQPDTETEARTGDDRCPGFCIPCMTDESHHPAP